MQVVSLLSIAVVTSIVPKEHDAAITQRLLRYAHKLRRRRISRISEKVSGLYGELTDNQADAIALERVLVSLELHWSRGRSLGLRPAGVHVDVEGFEHIEEALARGKGVLLWRMSLTGASAVNSVFFKLGLPITHLSTPNHLCRSDGWLARNVASPLLSHDEARYLLKRVVMENGRITGYLDKLRKALNANQIVTIVGDANRGRIKEVVEMGEMRYAIPTGAPGLAHSTDAGLYPCAAVRTGPFEYKLVIFEDATPSGHSNRRTFRSMAIETFAQRRLELVTQYPSSDMFL